MGKHKNCEVTLRSSIPSTPPTVPDTPIPTSVTDSSALLSAHHCSFTPIPYASEKSSTGSGKTKIQQTDSVPKAITALASTLQNEMRGGS